MRTRPSSRPDRIRGRIGVDLIRVRAQHTQRKMVIRQPLELHNAGRAAVSRDVQHHNLGRNFRQRTALELHADVQLRIAAAHFPLHARRELPLQREGQ